MIRNFLLSVFFFAFLSSFASAHVGNLPLVVALLHERPGKRTPDESIKDFCKALEVSKKHKASWVITSEMAFPYYLYLNTANLKWVDSDDYHRQLTQLQGCVDRTNTSLLLGAPVYQDKKIYSALLQMKPHSAWTVLRKKDNSNLKKTKDSLPPESFFETGSFMTPAMLGNIPLSLVLCSEVMIPKIEQEILKPTAPQLIISSSAWYDTEDKSRDFGGLLYYEGARKLGKTVLFANQDPTSKDLPLAPSFVLSDGKILYRSKKNLESHLIVVELNSNFKVLSVQEQSFK